MSWRDDEVRANLKARELDRRARVKYVALAHPARRWCVYRDADFTVDGATPIHTEALIASAPTWPEALEQFYHWKKDPRHEALFLDRHLKGENLKTMLPQVSAAIAEKQEAWRRHAREVHSDNLVKQAHYRATKRGYIDQVRAFLHGLTR
jgi:hypothetical protein